MMYWWNPYYAGPFGWIMPVFMVFFWIIVLVIVVRAIRFFTSDGRDSKNSARRILDERYAKGEIDKEEYAEKKKDLTS